MRIVAGGNCGGGGSQHCVMMRVRERGHSERESIVVVVVVGIAGVAAAVTY